ncbi:hypothetical protein BaRGS_00014774 [Batillaria attramentaria]|uniref:Uncharacterized protein n=1 Tax=Batillaria attramentaria TaxID=370345 RepID=A0ABD0L3A3_9CAEN
MQRQAVAYQKRAADKTSKAIQKWDVFCVLATVQTDLIQLRSSFIPIRDPSRLLPVLRKREQAIPPCLESKSVELKIGYTENFSSRFLRNILTSHPFPLPRPTTFRASRSEEPEIKYGSNQ